MAWRIPPHWTSLLENAVSSPEGSTVSAKQKKMLGATVEVLTAIARDMREGLLETVGVESSLSIDGGRCSMILELSAEADAEQIAAAIDAENIESWRDETGKVHVAVNPWYSTKDVDQAVLCAIKVIHVLLGIHATDNAPPPTFGQKLRSSLAEILSIQGESAKKKD